MNFYLCRRNSVYMLLTVIVMGLLRVSASATDSCSKHGNSVALRRSLKGAATPLLRSIRAGNARATLKVVSARGLGIGVDKPQLARTAVEEQFHRKNGVYCLLFSTTCMRSDKQTAEWSTDPVLSKFDTSLSDWLKGATPYKIETFLLTESEICSGLVRITPRAAKPDSTPLELEFTYERGEWKLINIPFSLGE